MAAYDSEYQSLSDKVDVGVCGSVLKFCRRSYYKGEETTRYILFSPSYFKVIVAELDSLMTCAEKNIYIERYFEHPEGSSRSKGDLGEFMYLLTQEFQDETYICFSFADKNRERVQGGINLTVTEAGALHEMLDDLAEKLDTGLAADRKQLTELYPSGDFDKYPSTLSNIEVPPAMKMFSQGRKRHATATVTSAVVGADGDGKAQVSGTTRKRRRVDNFFSVYNFFSMCIYRYVRNPADEKEQTDTIKDENDVKELAESNLFNDQSISASKNKRPVLRSYSSWFLDEGAARDMAYVELNSSNDIIIDVANVTLSTGVIELITYAFRKIALAHFWKTATKDCAYCHFERATAVAKNHVRCSACYDDRHDLFKKHSDKAITTIQAITISDIVNEMLCEMDLSSNRNLLWLTAKTVLRCTPPAILIDIDEKLAYPDWFNDVFDMFLEQKPLSPSMTDEDAEIHFLKYCR